MITHHDPFTLGPFYDKVFSRMRPPGTGDGVVVRRQREMPVVMAAIGTTEAGFAATYYDEARKESFVAPIARDTYERLLQVLPLDEVRTLGAVLVEDQTLDGESYAVKQRIGRRDHLALLSHPRNVSDGRFDLLVRQLDEFLNKARAAARKGQKNVYPLQPGGG